jgi:hypothetical protein
VSLLGWNPERLARRLNAFAQQQGLPERIHPKTPHKWAAGDIPRPAMALADHGAAHRGVAT